MTGFGLTNQDNTYKSMFGNNINKDVQENITQKYGY